MFLVELSKRLIVLIRKVSLLVNYNFVNPFLSTEETILCADILGITEELRYENERIDEVKNESTIHLAACEFLNFTVKSMFSLDQLGLENVNAGEVQYSIVMLIVVLF